MMQKEENDRERKKSVMADVGDGLVNNYSNTKNKS